MQTHTKTKKFSYTEANAAGQEPSKDQPRSKNQNRPERRRASKFERDSLKLDESMQGEEKRLRHLADTWPGTCKQCDQEFRYSKTQPEPERCPKCSGTTHKCQLCGRVFESKSFKAFCSAQC